MTSSLDLARQLATGAEIVGAEIDVEGHGVERVNRPSFLASLAAAFGALPFMKPTPARPKILAVVRERNGHTVVLMYGPLPGMTKAQYVTALYEDARASGIEATHSMVHAAAVYMMGLP